LISATARAGSSIEHCGVRYSNANGKAVVYDSEDHGDKSFVFLPYGIIDKMTLCQLGFPAITWTAGKQIPASALDYIRKKIILVPDKGEEEYARQLASNLGWRGLICNLNYPETFKDPNDFLRNKQSAQLTRQLNSFLKRNNLI
jgi:hypothetical protein